MRKSALVSLVVILTALSFASFAAAQATVTRAVFTEVADGFLAGGPCIGENLLLKGNLTIRTRTTVTPTGQQLTAGHVTAHMTATGLETGDRYQVINVGATITNLWRAGVVREGVSSARFLVIGSGGHNKALVTNLFHATITPSGNVTAEFFRITVKCVG
jgi:hypothetical protein